MSLASPYRRKGLGETPKYDVEVQIGEAQIIPAQEVWQDASNFFMDLYYHAPRDKKVLLINNSFQLLWRSLRQAGVPSTDPFAKKLDATMARWYQWKLDYDAYAWQFYNFSTPNFSAQLDAWAATFRDLVQEADARVRTILAQKYNVDAASIDAMQADPWDQAGRDFIKRLAEILGSTWFWPVAGALTGVWVLKKLLDVLHEVQDR